MSKSKKDTPVSIYYWDKNEKFIPDKNTTFFSVYNGKKLKKVPTYGTKTGDKINPYFHVGNKHPTDNSVMFHNWTLK